MKYNIVLFGVKSSTNQIISFFKDDIDLVITLDNTSKEKYHISGVDDVYSNAKQNNIKVHSISDYSLKEEIEFFEDNSFDLGIVYGWQRIIPENIFIENKYNYKIINLFNLLMLSLSLLFCIK